MPFAFLKEVWVTFSSHILAKYRDKCFDKFCPSLQKVDKKGRDTIKKRTCWKCSEYHPTIKAMNSHKERATSMKMKATMKSPKKMEMKMEKI